LAFWMVDPPFLCALFANAPVSYLPFANFFFPMVFPLQMFTRVPGTTGKFVKLSTFEVTNPLFEQFFSFSLVGCFFFPPFWFLSPTTRFSVGFLCAFFFFPTTGPVFFPFETNYGGPRPSLLKKTRLSFVRSLFLWKGTKVIVLVGFACGTLLRVYFRHPGRVPSLFRKLFSFFRQAFRRLFPLWGYPANNSPVLSNLVFPFWFSHFLPCPMMVHPFALRFSRCQTFLRGQADLGSRLGVPPPTKTPLKACHQNIVCFVLNHQRTFFFVSLVLWSLVGVVFGGTPCFSIVRFGLG